MIKGKAGFISKLEAILEVHMHISRIRLIKTL